MNIQISESGRAITDKMNSPHRSLNEIEAESLERFRLWHIGS